MYCKTAARVSLALAFALAFAFLSSAVAQSPAPAAPSPATPAPGVKRTLLQKADLGDRDMIMGTAEIPAGGSVGRHFHHGTESGYVLEGSATLEIDGEAARVINAGDSYVIPAGKIHDAKTVGDKQAKVLAIYVVEKGKPLAVTAP